MTGRPALRKLTPADLADLLPLVRALAREAARADHAAAQAHRGEAPVARQDDGAAIAP